MFKLLILVLSISNIASANEANLWSDEKGIIKSEKCEFLYMESTPLKILTNTTSDHVRLKAEDADFNYEVFVGSVVKILKSVGANSSLVEVMSFQGTQDPDRDLIASVGTRGILSNQYLGELSTGALNLEGEAHRIFSDVFEVEHIKLNATLSNKGYKVAKCNLGMSLKQRIFVIFDIRGFVSKAKISEVGVGLNQSTLLSFTHLNSKAFRVNQELPKLGNNKFNLFSHIVCSEAESVDVFNQDQSLVLFQTKTGEMVIPFQSFDGSSSKRIRNSQDEEEIYQKVKFIEREAPDNVGWIDKSIIELTSKCPYIETPDEDGEAEPEEDASYVFPIIKQPTHPYDSGMRRFGARRGGGSRLHAANDLYREKNDAVVAIQGGEVIRALYPFYQGTFAIEIKHDSGKVVRYGEISAKKVAGRDLSVGSRVNKKDIVGFIGELNSGCCNPMLHFELYSGKGNGRLSDSSSGNLYNRRWDLLDPTKLLKEWEKSCSWN